LGFFRNVGREIHDMMDKPRARGSVARRAGLAVGSFVILALIFTSSLTPESFDVRAGQIAPKDVRAPQETVDRAKTEKLREEKAALVKDVYEQDPAVLPLVNDEIEKAYAVARVIKADPSLSSEKKTNGLMEVSDAPQQSYAAFLRTDSATINALRDASKLATTKVLGAGVRSDSLEPYYKQIELEVESIRYSKDLRLFAAGVGKKALRPNLVLNADETLRKREEAKKTVEPVKVLKGQLILRAGEIVTDDHMVVLRDLGIITTGPQFSALMAGSVYSLLLVSAVVIYLWRFERQTFENESKALLIVFVFFAILLFSSVLSRVSGYLMPVAAGTMLYATIVEPRFAVLMGIVLSLASNIIAGSDLRFLIVCLVGATAGVFGIVHLEQRSGLMRAGVGVSVSSLLTIGALGLTEGLSPFDVNLLEQQFWGLLNGIVSAVLTMGSLPFFEGLFGIITPVKLIELSNPNHPLLKRLLVEAPGTYHHSILVGNLAEAATEAVGGNSLLARVGAYYHDVGKTKRPYFFIENQMGIDNPHDKTSPTLSTLIITAHVRDGVEMAKEHGIPERIIEFIREHHGTTLVSYFFTRATGGDPATEYAEQDFRYEGPRPTSKETAIVMLADSVEAAVRSMGTLPAARIESAVKKIVRDKLNDHQLDKCDLTLGDLDVISEVFTSVLSGIFHPRIEYPEEKPVVEVKAGPETQNGSRGNSLKKKRPGIRRSARPA